ncbi:unnamed protein product [Ceutorhynchus assimilis]|uniref:Cytochrome P450 n=1 Tax=Ceutorhynchus assimilis TaxID=467358 RepID=A0A9N9QQ87_9CUCU|nr:unnamed protein product [Ceutorhynchus assimilis]
MLLFVFKVLCWFVFLVAAYNLGLIVFRYRHVKFAWNTNGYWAPLLPFIGNTYLAVLTGRRVNMLTTLLWAERYFGLPCSFWFSYKYHYMCNNAEEAKIVLNHPKCLNKAQLYGDVQYLFRNSLLLIDAEKWKPRRRYLRNGFKSNILKSFFPTFYQQSCYLVEEIKNVGPEQDLYKFFNKYAFMNFFLTSFGYQGEEDLDLVNIKKFGALIDSIQDEFVKLLANPLIPAFIWIRIPPGAQLRAHRAEIGKVIKLIIQDKKKRKLQVSEYVGNPNERPLVDLLLSDAYEKEYEDELYEEFTLFAGARKVYEEVMEVVGDHTIQEANIQNLRYTEAVVSEVLRILPTIPLYGRYCEEDIDIGTKVVPKGANVFISAFHIQRNPDYWEDPLKFDPTRFLPENMSKIIPGSYLPFSAGPRNCIGQGMATILMKITVANIVKNFEITSKHKSIKEFKLESCISMKTLNHLDCHFTPRDKA